MRHLLLLFITACLVLGCNSAGDNDKRNLLQGAWTLQQVDYPIGHTETYGMSGMSGESPLTRYKDTLVFSKNACSV